MENIKIKNKLKNVLVTGGAGFIGSNLVNELIRQGNKVAVIDNLSSGKRESVNQQAKFYKMDVRDLKIAAVLKKEKIEDVFHLAAQPIVGTAYDNPFETIENNVMGTVNLLEVCRLAGKLKSIVVVSSDKAYGQSKNLPYTEESPLKGSHPYDASKAAADLIAQAYAKTYNLPIAVTRFSNVFGPGDLNFNRIIPGILESIIKNKVLLVRSNGKMIREYTFVGDIVRGCIKLAESRDKFKGEAFNFGSKNIFSVIELIKKAGEILGIKVNYKILNIAKNEIPKQYLDWAKAKEKLNWQPKISFKDGIKKTFDWYKNNLYDEINSK